MGHAIFKPTNEIIGYLVGISIVEAVTIATFACRFIGRWVLKTKLGWDDIIIIPAFILSLMVYASYWSLTYLGLGASWDKAQLNQEILAKILLINEISHAAGFNLAKISALCFYLRLFANRTMQRLIVGCMVVIGLWLCANVLAYLLVCLPLERLWTTMTCPDRTPIYIATSAFAIISDIVLLALPMPLIWNLKMRLDAKVGLTCVFALGLGVIGVSAFRIAALSQISWEENVTGTSNAGNFASALEINFTIICTNAPSVYSLWLKYRKHPKSSGGGRDASDDIINSTSINRNKKRKNSAYNKNLSANATLKSLTTVGRDGVNKDVQTTRGAFDSLECPEAFDEETGNLSGTSTLAGKAIQLGSLRRSNHHHDSTGDRASDASDYVLLGDLPIQHPDAQSYHHNRHQSRISHDVPLVLREEPVEHVVVVEADPVQGQRSHHYTSSSPPPVDSTPSSIPPDAETGTTTWPLGSNRGSDVVNTYSDQRRRSTATHGAGDTTGTSRGIQVKTSWEVYRS